MRRTHPAPPVRLVHLGLGAFFRAHQAWYTHHAEPGWGIAAFTGRSARMAEILAAQDGLYTVITRDGAGDRVETVASLAAVHAAADHAAWLRHLADPAVRAVTLTVTEAGYPRAEGGGLDHDRPDVAADVAALRADPRAAVSTVPARLVAGLAARRAADAGPVTLVPCDNLPGNGTVLGGLVGALAERVDAGLAEWIAEHVETASTMVDRITPATTAADLIGDDRAPVVTEPFTEWVLQGGFAAGRPRWERAGARFVADVERHERRKLWMLNGAHSLLAYSGPARGHVCVDEAIADPACRRLVETWWDEAAPHLELPPGEIADYRAALLTRFANPRLRHRLAQIAADGSQKVPVRFLPVLRAERAAGRLPAGAVAALALWMAHLRTGVPDVTDPCAAALTATAAGPHPVPALLATLAADLPDDRELVAAVADATPAV